MHVVHLEELLIRRTIHANSNEEERKENIISANTIEE